MIIVIVTLLQVVLYRSVSFFDCNLLQHLIVTTKFLPQGKDVTDPLVLQSLEEAVRLNKSLSKLMIDGSGCIWTNVATAILKGATKNTSLRKMELVSPESSFPPQEIIDEVRKANPKVQLLLHTGRESTTHHEFLVHCPESARLLSQVVSVGWSVGTNLVRKYFTEGGTLSH